MKKIRTYVDRVLLVLLHATSEVFLQLCNGNQIVCVARQRTDEGEFLSLSICYL